MRLDFLFEPARFKWCQQGLATSVKKQSFLRTTAWILAALHRQINVTASLGRLFVHFSTLIMTLADILVIVAGILIAFGNKSADLNTRKLVSGILQDPAVTVMLLGAVSATHVNSRRTGGLVSMGYLTNYGALTPNNVPVDTLSHILYAFADINTDGTAYLTTSSTDEQNLSELYQIKLKQRNLKVLLSIGGGTASGEGHFNFVTDAALRANFVTSAVHYGLDGIDLDYEYPSSTAEGSGFADLFTELRTAFSTLQSNNGETEPYQLTAAINAVNYNNQFFVVSQTDAALTYWNIMGYDYSGSRTGTSGDGCVNHIVSEGATLAKIVMGQFPHTCIRGDGSLIHKYLGMPLYGRSFEETAGLGASYTGVGPGTYPYSQLPLAGATVSENTTDITSYSYNSATQEFVSFDTAAVGKLKAQYIQNKGLAGSMFWELSSDKVGAASLVGTVANTFGTLDQTQNHIKYPSLVYPSKQSRSRRFSKARQV
ncbi:hypothetical protein HWV62_29166 [Athelia sp. TMB]|nr:hypothetical protein HWV62_29166 [Athelia sp. TMB]